jgi:hypothetical protein
LPADAGTEGEPSESAQLVLDSISLLMAAKQYLGNS